MANSLGLRLAGLESWSTTVLLGLESCHPQTTSASTTFLVPLPASSPHLGFRTCNIFNGRLFSAKFMFFMLACSLRKLSRYHLFWNWLLDVRLKMLLSQTHTCIGSLLAPNALTPAVCFGASLLKGHMLHHLPAFGTPNAPKQQRDMNTRAPDDVNSFVREVRQA